MRGKIDVDWRALTFERTFGYRSLSTIAPHYILPILAEEVLTKAGIRYIQGANQRIVQDSNGHKTVFRHSLGERGLNNSIYLTRTIKFEPFLGLSKTRILEVRDKIQRLWEASIPCVIDFHRINICSPWQDTAIESLHELLSSISHSNPFFLNSQELGEAISNKGIFTDSFHDTERKLTPSYPTPRHAIRYGLSRVHRAQLKSADY